MNTLTLIAAVLAAVIAVAAIAGRRPTPTHGTEPERVPAGPSRPPRQATPPAGIEFRVPAIGTPGTATDRQIAAVERALGITMDQPMSREQASMVLCARDYAEAMVAVFEREQATLDEQVAVPLTIAFIMSSPEVRDYVTKWGEDRFNRGTHHSDPRLRRNEHFARVHAFLAARF